jgi:hypothetical protein
MKNTTMNTGAASLSDEQIEALKAAALAATPQNIDSAQRIERYEDGSFISCPACGGEGNVELNSDFCNYDGEALGVQFYGIGNAHKLAEDYFRMVKPATALALIERLQRAEAAATPQADAAPIINGHAINDLFLKWSEWTTELGEAISRKNIDGFVSELRAAIAAGGAQEPSATREEIERARDRVLTQSKNSLFRSGAKICAAEILSPTKPCTKPPEGWTCSRIEGHEGPCAASPAASNGEQA